MSKKVHMSKKTATTIKELLRTIQDISRVMSNCTRATEEDQKATYLQLQALDLLAKRSLLPVGSIGAELRLSKSSATQLVERLVSAGFVNKLPDSEDKRSVLLELTAAGAKEREILSQKIHKHCSLLFEGLTSTDLQVLLRIHKKILAHLGQKSEFERDALS